jgi:hypothetical protein
MPVRSWQEVSKVTDWFLFFFFVVQRPGNPYPETAAATFKSSSSGKISTHGEKTRNSSTTRSTWSAVARGLAINAVVPWRSDTGVFGIVRITGNLLWPSPRSSQLSSVETLMPGHIVITVGSARCAGAASWARTIRWHTSCVESGFVQIKTK